MDVNLSNSILIYDRPQRALPSHSQKWRTIDSFTPRRSTALGRTVPVSLCFGISGNPPSFLCGTSWYSECDDGQYPSSDESDRS